MKNIKTLIIPDVHGREFWKVPVEDILHNYKDSNIVFLGDYHDPYRFENINEDESLENFRKIVNLKKEYPDRITLLLGNHDCSYIKNTSICRCRHDFERDEKFRDIYHKEINLFDMVYKDGKFLFSHAGIIPDWVEQDYFFWNHQNGKSPDVFLNEELKKSLIKDENRFWFSMESIGFIRGGNDNAGSIIWGDLSEHIRRPYKDYIQVFGHTQQEESPIHYKDTYLDENGESITNEFFCLDCRKAFYLDNNYKIRFYDNDEEIEEKNTLFNNWKW